jgi:hypothetical protein
MLAVVDTTEYHRPAAIHITLISTPSTSSSAYRQISQTLPNKKLFHIHPQTIHQNITNTSFTPPNHPITPT